MALGHLSMTLLEEALRVSDQPEFPAWLSPGEHEVLAGLSHPKRRLDWLAGRLAAKGTLRHLERLHTIPEKDLVIGSTEDGMPSVIAAGTEESASIRLSISHCPDLAVAFAGAGCTVGVDVEQIRASILEIEHDFATEDEIGAFDGRAGINRPRALTHLWTLKEAVLKAGGPQKVPVGAVHIVGLTARGDYFVAEGLHPSAGRFRCLTYQNGRLVFGLACGAEG